MDSHFRVRLQRLEGLSGGLSGESAVIVLFVLGAIIIVYCCRLRILCCVADARSASSEWKRGKTVMMLLCYL